MDSCIFCKIIRKEEPAEIVFETDAIIGIVPKEQVSKGHTLLLPKKHYKDLSVIDEDILKELVISAKKLSSVLKEKHQATGINLLHASGKDAQQSVFHFHIHIVPRYPNDGLDLWIREKL